MGTKLNRAFMKNVVHATNFVGQAKVAVIKANSMSTEIMWYLDNGAKVEQTGEPIEGDPYLGWCLELPAIPSIEWELNK